MKPPVDPDVLRYRLVRREAGIKLAIWVVVILVAIAAWIGGLVLANTVGGGEGIFMYAGISLMAGILFIPLSIMTFEPDNPMEKYMSAAYDLKIIENSVAWHAQQEELQRLRTIMKEEGQ